jgi:hypothetical protein
MIDIISLLIGLGLFHIFILPILMGFYHGYRDALDGKPYNNTDTDEDIED